MTCMHLPSVTCPDCSQIGPGANAMAWPPPSPQLSADALIAMNRVLLNAALDAIGQDGHVFGGRPCSTCAAVSSLAGRDFGCVARAKRLAR